MDVITDKHDIELTIDKTYSNFEDFYSENKYGIFVGFLELFYEMENIPEQDMFSLIINWKINDSNVHTEYQYDRSAINMLTDFLLPYFEQLEEYEMCSEIKELYTRLHEIK